MGAQEYKKKIVENLANKISSSRTVMVVSTKGLPASQFQEIKKKLRGKAEVVVAKKSLILRAISKVEKGALQGLKEEIGANVALVFSDLDAFALAGILLDYQTPTKAKIGDIAIEDIRVEAGPTDLSPGPAISELGNVGLKVAVENGKLAIKEAKVIANEGDVLDEKLVSVLGKLNILPMKVGFIPLAAYDSESDEIFKNIKIDKEGTLNSLRESIGKAFAFAVSIAYATKETISYLIGKAALEEKTLSKVLEEKGNVNEVQESEKEEQK